MKKKRFVKIMLGLLALSSLASCGKSEGQVSSSSVVEEKSLGNYDYYVSGYEFGPAVDKAVIHLNDGNAVRKEDLSKGLFKVSVNTANGSGEREVEDVYLVDSRGERDDGLVDGSDIGIDLKVVVSYTKKDSAVYTDYHYASPFTMSLKGDFKSIWDKKYTLEFTLQNNQSLKVGSKTYTSSNGDFKIDKKNERIIPSLNEWTDNRDNTFDGKTLYYKAYEGEKLKNDGVKNPLIIWLHGLGEGGTNPEIAILGNDVTNITEDKIQSYFKNEEGSQGAYVLAVQTSTMWLDSGDGTSGIGDARSIYTKALKNTIDKYLDENKDIDTDRIYLGGCSNGGYMTMNMAMEYGDFFAAYYPVCEAYLNSAISDEDISKLKDLPIWFVASQTDTTVDLNTYELPTYQRLMQSGAQNVHFSLFENVMSDETGTDIEYNGHFSWIYLFQDRVDKDIEDFSNPTTSSKTIVINGKEVGLWEWLSSFKKSS